MRRILVLLGVLAVGGLHAVAIAGPYGEGTGAGRCPGALGAGAYRCTVRGEDASTFVDCYRFTGGQVSAKFDLTSARLGAAIGCSCKPGGSTANPTFGASAAFTCTSDLGVAFEGRVSRGGVITKGAVTNAQGGSYAFTCTRDDACALP
jgi:hypothetical protein